ncbi:MAG: hypothetical protein PHQ59_04620 [Candidatus Daviesbacteria bacterium]|nr:hypothetical protein [Candidatus Daviesbacteria bacterium]
MEEVNKGLLNKKNIIALLVIGIMLLVIPVGVKLASEQQLFKSRAAADPITFSGDSVSPDKRTTTSTTFTIELRSPLGPPAP